MIILNTPSNPTGGILEEPLLKEIAALAVERDLWVLSDEIYGRILYEGCSHFGGQVPRHAGAHRHPGLGSPRSTR
jgi:aspartate/methionine/tyrosine aminotransferase